MKALPPIFIILLILLTGCKPKSSAENALLFLAGKWIIDPERSRIASMASSESKSIDWEKYQNSITGKTLFFENGHITCNQINSGNPFEITLNEAASFAFIFEQTQFGTPIIIKRVSDGFIRVDWSVNMVEIYRKIDRDE